MEVQKKQLEKKATENLKQNLNYQRDKDREMVKGIFRFHEVPKGQLDFSVRLHKGDPIKRYSMKDGEVYTIPLGVARHLNRNVAYPIHSFEKDEKGTVSQRIGETIHRCSFQSLEFIDIEDVPTAQ